MIGIVLITHGNLGNELVKTLNYVAGDQPFVKIVCLHEKDDIDQRRNEILQAIKDVDNKQGTIVLTDMFGGTPSNLALSLALPGKVEVIAGVNLPMLVELARLREVEALDKVITSIQDAGRKSIQVASKLLKAQNK